MARMLYTLRRTETVVEVDTLILTVPAQGSAFDEDELVANLGRDAVDTLLAAEILGPKQDPRAVH